MRFSGVDDIEAYGPRPHRSSSRKPSDLPGACQYFARPCRRSRDDQSEGLERGVGLTRACGTAACAVGVSAARTKRTGRVTRVNLPGGVLVIDWREDDHVMMTGPVETEFHGLIDRATLDYRILPPTPARGAA